MSRNTSLSLRLAELKRAVTGNGGSRGLKSWQFATGLLLLVLSYNLWQAKGSQLARHRSGLEHRFWVVCQESYPARDRFGAFLELVTVGNDEWRAAHLYGLNLTGIWLPNTDLHAVDFTGGNLTEATLAGAKFAQGRLQQADLTEADLSRANLSGTILYKALLKRAQLRQANLRGAILQEVEAQNADLWAADLSTASLLMANLSGANLSGANLSGASLEAAVLTGANLFLTGLTGVNLKDADLTDCNWWRARGLSPAQIAWLGMKYPPTEKSAASVREDYQAWLNTIGSMK